MGNSIGLKGWSSVINGALILRPLNRVKLHLYLPTPPSPLKLHILVPFPFEPPLREGNGRVEKRGTRWGGGCRGLGRSNRRGRLGLRFRIRIGRGWLRGSTRGFGALLWSRGCRPCRWLASVLGALTLLLNGLVRVFLLLACFGFLEFGFCTYLTTRGGDCDSYGCWICCILHREIMWFSFDFCTQICQKSY